MRLPGFTAVASLPSVGAYHERWREEEAIGIEDVMPAAGPKGGMGCLQDCINMAFPVGTPMASGQLEEALKTCAVICGVEYTEDLWQQLLKYRPPGPWAQWWAQWWARYGGYIWRGWGPTAWVAGGTLVGIGGGTLLGYEIEEHGWLAPKWPKPAAKAASCIPVGPNTQHQHTEFSHLGCARSESLARIAAEDDCQSRTGRCTGTCPNGVACKPHAHVWNTVTVPAEGFFDALWNGCSTTAYYTCACGC